MLLVPPLMALMLVAADEPAARIAPPPPISQVPTWNITLPEAIRIGLANSPVARVIFPAPGPVAVPPGREARSANLAISAADPDADEWGFQSAIMAHVRSIEQQYWALSSQQTAVWIREATIKLAEEAVRREKADLGGGRLKPVDMAEVDRAIEALKTALEAARADRTTIERQFRNILGLPVEDRRKMLAATPPVLAPTELRWEACLAEMTARQPDIQALRRSLAAAQAQADQRPGDAAQAAVARQKAFYDQVVQGTTKSLARFFAEIEAQYKHLTTAQRLTIAAQQRLAAQRASYDQGRITIDRLLDAITQYANAVSQESLYASSYNTTLAAFEEAQGTILPHGGIQILAPRRRPDGPAKLDAPTDDGRLTKIAP